MKPNDLKQLVREALQFYSESEKKRVCQQCKGKGGYHTTLKDRSGKSCDGMGIDHYVPCDFPGCKNGIVDRDENYRITRGEQKETITRSQLKEVIKETLRTILKEMYGRRRVLSMLEEGPISLGDLQSAWREDQSGEYVQINPDDSVWYIAHGRAREQIAPKGERNPFPKIGIWMQRGGVILNIWKVNDHGNIELMSRSGKELGGLAEQIYEMTTTGAVAPINLPGNVKGGWVASKGGSARGVAGSKALGYELTPIGKKDMARKQDPVY